MRFSLLSQLLLGLTASVCVQGAPGGSLAVRNGVAPRGMPYLDTRSLFDKAKDNNSDADNGKGKGKGKDNGKGKNNGKNNDKEVQIQVVEIAASVKKDGKQITFVEKVTKIIVKNKGNDKKKNQKRKKAVKKQNKDKTVVIQVVQVIIDVDNGGKKRYAKSQQTVNKGANETVTAQMTDANTLTVGAGDCGDEDATAIAAGTAASGAVLADATATAVAMALSTDSAAAAEMDTSKATVIQPEDSEAPEAEEGVQVMEDPAADLAKDDVSSCGVE